MRLSVVLGEWLDRPLDADLAVAVAADRLGYSEVWIGEMAKLDAFVMAGLVLANTSSIEPCVGPLPVTVRSPVQIALATATAAAGWRRRVHVALGTSSDVVARWHGRTRRGAATRLAATLTDVRALFAGGRVDGFRLRGLPPAPTLTVAAFGRRALDVAAGADRMVLNMVTVDAARGLARRHANTAAWLVAAVDPTPRERRWISRGFAAYLGAPGYAEMFEAAGFGELVAFARSRPHPRDLATRIPDELLDVVGVVGDEPTVRRRLADYEAAGLTEVALVVPPLELACGRAALDALAPR